MERKTKQQILKETFDYYNEDPTRRAKSDGRCQYLDNQGRMCAFGRCEIDPPLSDGISDSVIDRFDSNEDDMSDCLKEEYRGHSSNFWMDLQVFHDTDYNWDLKAGKASDGGVRTYKHLLQLWID